jgi:hypothetical protein
MGDVIRIGNPGEFAELDLNSPNEPDQEERICGPRTEAARQRRRSLAYACFSGGMINGFDSGLEGGPPILCDTSHCEGETTEPRFNIWGHDFGLRQVCGFRQAAEDSVEPPR